jgi:hypothetical protein
MLLSQATAYALGSSGEVWGPSWHRLGVNPAPFVYFLVLVCLVLEVQTHLSHVVVEE